MNTNLFKETVLYNQEREANDWTELLSRNEFLRTLRVTAWALRFLHIEILAQC